MLAKELEIFGKNGTVRDYIYVTDIATGIIAILDFGIIGEAYNIGTGIGKSNLDIVEELKIYANQNNIEVLLRFNEERKFDVKRNILNYSKINEISGWKNKIDIESGLKMTWDCNFKLQQNETIFI